jgi:valyl-tRNA synthetase
MPFRDVYFTGMVRDSKRRKMSKQLGNSPDALTLIDTYGADGVRFGMLSCSSAGNDIIFDAPIDPKTGEAINESKLCEQGRNFCNKMWNALRLIDGWKVSQDKAADASSEVAAQWMEARLAQVTSEVSRFISEYRLNDALMELYKFIWGDFCSWYLEMIKPTDGVIAGATHTRTIELYEHMMTLLHPFMPFVTEEIWHGLKPREKGDDCCVSTWPTAGDFDAALITQVEQAKEAVTKVRETRSAKGIKYMDQLKLSTIAGSETEALAKNEGLRAIIERMANLESLQISTREPDNSIAFLVGNDTFYLELNQEVDTAAEIERITADLEYTKGFVASVEKKLSNERFVNNAPAAVVDRERQKMADGLAKIKSMEEELARLG